METAFKYLDRTEVVGVVNLFLKDVEPQLIPGPTSEFDNRQRAFVYKDLPGYAVSMTRMEWIPTGGFRKSLLGRVLMPPPYTDIILQIEDILEPENSRTIKARDGDGLGRVSVKQGDPTPLKTRLPNQDDLNYLNGVFQEMRTLGRE